MSKDLGQVNVPSPGYGAEVTAPVFPLLGKQIRPWSHQNKSPWKTRSKSVFVIIKFEKSVHKTLCGMNTHTHISEQTADKWCYPADKWLTIHSNAGCSCTSPMGLGQRPHRFITECVHPWAGLLRSHGTLPWGWSVGWDGRTGWFVHYLSTTPALWHLSSLRESKTAISIILVMNLLYCFGGWKWDPEKQ